MVERDAQVLEERDLAARLIIPRHKFVEDAEVASLLYISNSSEDEPHRVVVETATDVVVSSFCERLILMIAATIGELSRSNVDDALTGTAWHLMHEAHKVLVRIAEAHSTSDAALEERCRTREVERNHALILIPDVDHAVETLVARLNGIFVEQLVPLCSQLGESLVYSLNSRESRDGLLRLLLVYKRYIACLRRN